MKATSLTEEDVERAAQALGVEVAVLKAVIDVESRGKGFIDGKPRITFEGHVFWRQLAARGIDPERLVSGNEDILYRAWSRGHYLVGAREHERLEKAKAINEEAALEATSWGLFQIMGLNARALGYSTVQEFARLMGNHEREHLEAFVRFVRLHNLVGHLKDHAWDQFTRKYNGPSFGASRYDVRLREAYLRHKG